MTEPTGHCVLAFVSHSEMCGSLLLLELGEVLDSPVGLALTHLLTGVYHAGGVVARGGTRAYPEMVGFQVIIHRPVTWTGLCVGVGAGPL